LSDSAAGKEHGESVPACFGRAGGTLASVYLLSSISLGVGVFALPQVFNLCGWFLGCILLVVFALASGFTSWMVLQCAKQLQVVSFEDLVLKSLGMPGLVYYSAAMATTCFIGNASHIQAVGSMFGDLMYWFVTDKPTTEAGEWHLESYKKAVLMAVLLTIVLPFCFQSRINNLRWIGTLSVAVVCLNVSMFVGYCIYLQAAGFVPEDTSHNPINTSTAVQLDVGNIFRAAGTVAFAYTPLLNLFNVVKEMPDPRKATPAVGIATILCFIVYLITGLAGNLTFKAITQSNCVYNTLPQHRMAFRIPWLMLVCCITLLYPVVNFPMVVSIEFLIGKRRHSRTIISAVGCILILLVTMVVTDIVDLFGLCASLGLGSVIFIIPCLVYLRLDPAPLTSITKVGVIVTLVLGLLITFVTTYFIIEHIISLL